MQATQREYQATFATSALKTILYSSTPRNPAIPLDQSLEVDYLLASVKEDYADDSALSPEESLSPLRDNIVAIMEPFADNFDYMFYAYVPDRKTFPILMLYYSRWSAVSDNASDQRRASPADPKEDVIVYCAPNSLDEVDLLLSSVGTVYQSNSRMRLIEQTGTGKNNLVSQVSLSMWTATKLPEGILSENRLNCHTCSAKKTKQGQTYKWGKC